ncbi:MAG: sugar transferase [Eubacteriales bacterium]|nr:sugar transferase [Eubacteriales bacterium]
MFNYVNRTRDGVQNIILFFTDSICIFLAYYLSGFIWLVYYKKYGVEYTMNELGINFVSVLVAALITALFTNVTSDFVVRGKFEELKSVVRKMFVFGAAIAMYELLKRDTEIPRGIYVITVVGGGLLIYLTRFIVKWYLLARGRSRAKANRVIVVTMKDRAESTMKQIDKSEDWVRTVAGIIILDEDMIGEEFGNVNVVANAHTMMRYIKNEVVDEVYIDVNYQLREQIKSMVMELEDMGVTVHLKLEVLDSYKDFDTTLGHLGTIPVVTFANRIFDYKELFIKRIFDICGALIGIMIMLIAMIFVAPAIKLESKGPLFFKQKRVGKNGRYFYIYKFRSMYVDAEDRLKELMEKNEMSGLMFKMTDDPRITRTGKFIRKTSIDELPQFINVLKGDMSLVGTRPPTVNEFKQYEGHHKRRLSMKPGITGMWQAYGRNSVQDFEDVVRMDLDYIDHWNLGLDMKIIGKTIVTVFTNGGK